MYGGLKKTASRLALVAAAGVLSTNAYAADLGGDCCADLEERVAELEATTARKGTRRTSLEVYGQVNKSMVYWNDGARSNMALGVDNHNSSSRVGFRGNAKISPSVTAGYSMLFEWGDKARTSTTSQANDIGASRGNPGYGSNSRIDDAFVRLRDSNVWIESATVGRLTMGRFTSENALGSPDIAGIQHAAGDDFGCNGGGLAWRRSDTGALTSRTVGGAAGFGGAGCGGPWANRVNGLKYNSPSLAGFTLTAAVGESLKVENPLAPGGATPSAATDATAANLANAGRLMGVAGKYAGEFSGIRVAASVGYEINELDHELTGGPGTTPDQLAPLGAAVAPIGVNSSGKSRLLNLGLGLMHVPTGLFAQGEWSRINYDVQNPQDGSFRGGRDATRWHVAAGIGQNWTGAGRTTIYGEYERWTNYGYATTGYSATDVRNCTTVGVPCTYNGIAGLNKTGATLGGALSGDSFKAWGIGLNQAIDSAAMDLYINGRVMSATDAGAAATAIVNPVTGATGAAAAPAPLKDITVITTGARIRF
jgi:Gram-negative porin